MKNQVLFLCHYLVAMCACIPQKKITIKEPFTLKIWAAKDHTSCCGLGFIVTQIGEQLHTVRVEYGMCCRPQEWWAPIASRILSERNENIK